MLGLRQVFANQSNQAVSILSIAADLFVARVKPDAPGLGADRVADALRELFAVSGDLRLGALTRQLLTSSLAAPARTWLADGPNDPLDPARLGALFSEQAIATFAGRLDIGTSLARAGLAAMLPELIDRHSSGGELPAAVAIRERLQSALDLFR